MAKPTFEEVSTEEAIQRWNDSTEKFANILGTPLDPFDRQTPDWYDLDNWVLRIKNGFVVGMAGWKDYGDFAVLGGLKAIEKKHPSGLGGDNAKELLNYRKQKLGSKPKIAGLRSSKMPQEDWVAYNVAQGFEMTPEDAKEQVPFGLVDKFTERYGDDWGILKMTPWWSIIKNYEPEWLI